MVPGTVTPVVKMLFPDGLNQLPRLKTPTGQAYVLNELANSISDGPGQQERLFIHLVGIP